MQVDFEHVVDAGLELLFRAHGVDGEPRELGLGLDVGHGALAVGVLDRQDKVEEQLLRDERGRGVLGPALALQRHDKGHHAADVDGRRPERLAQLVLEGTPRLLLQQQVDFGLGLARVQVQAGVHRLDGQARVLGVADAGNDRVEGDQVVHVVGRHGRGHGHQDPRKLERLLRRLVHDLDEVDVHVPHKGELGRARRGKYVRVGDAADLLARHRRAEKRRVRQAQERHAHEEAQAVAARDPRHEAAAQEHVLVRHKHKHVLVAVGPGAVQGRRRAHHVLEAAVDEIQRPVQVARVVGRRGPALVARALRLDGLHVRVVRVVDKGAKGLDGGEVALHGVEAAHGVVAALLHRARAKRQAGELVREERRHLLRRGRVAEARQIQDRDGVRLRGVAQAHVPPGLTVVVAHADDRHAAARRVEQGGRAPCVQRPQRDGRGAGVARAAIEAVGVCGARRACSLLQRCSVSSLYAEDADESVSTPSSAERSVKIVEVTNSATLTSTPLMRTLTW